MAEMESFLTYLNSLEDEYYFFIANTTLGRIQTPYHKPVLSQRILSFLLNTGNRANIMASLDDADRRLVSFAMLMQKVSIDDVRLFFSSDSFPMLITRMDTLSDRLLLLRQDECYSINPVLEADIRDYIFDPLTVFGSSRIEIQSQAMVDRNTVFAILNLLSNGSVPVREANAHHFIKSDKLEKVFPQFPKKSSLLVHEKLKSLALSTGALQIKGDHYMLNREKAQELLELDSLNLFIRATDPKLGSSIAKTLGILRRYSASFSQTRKMIQIFSGCSDQQANRTLDLLSSFGLLVSDSDRVTLNPALMESPLERSGLSADTDMQVSYFGIPEYDDILYLFSDIQICDKMVRYIITKDSFTRGLESGLSAQSISDYLGTETHLSQFKLWEKAAGRVSLFDGIVLKGNDDVSRIVRMHPSLKEHILQELGENLFLMRRSTYPTWQQILSHALDMAHLPSPRGEAPEMKETADQKMESFALPEDTREKATKQTGDWTTIEAELIEDARRKGCLSDNVLDLIKARLIVSKDQLGRDFKYASMHSVSGFDYNAKLAALRNAIKGGRSLLRFELTDETLIVKPIEILRGEPRNSVIKVNVLPDGIERSIPVSAIFKLTVLRWSIS